MKIILLFLFMISLSFANSAQSDLDEAYGYRIETKTPKSNRDIANENEVEPSDKEVEVVDESDRDLASQDDEKEQKDFQKT
jgi:hypothetical protein